MKKILITLILGTGIFAATSCSDFLDQTSQSEYTKDNVYESLHYTKLALNKVYGELNRDETYSQYIPIVWGLNTDCELVDGLGNDAINPTSERGNMNYNANPGWKNLTNLWGRMYGIIEAANTVIDGIDGSSKILEEGSDKKTMLQYRAEAMTLRAMIYFDLIRFFGDIPMKMEPTNPDQTNIYQPKTDRDEIMDRLILDLDEAINDLPWAGTVTQEHITKGYAHGLLANIALTRAGWSIREKAKDGYETASYSDPVYPTQRCGAEKREEMYNLALKHLSIIISSGAHQENPRVADYWYDTNQGVVDNRFKENLFEIPMGISNASELGYTVGVRISGASSYYGPKGNSSGKLKLTAPYLWSFDKDDLRRDLTCATYELKEEQLNDNAVIKENMQSNTPFQIYCAKWDIRKMSEAWRQAARATSDKCMTGINVVRMRYPQVLLMYAEVMNELHGADAVGEAGISAREALRKVRVRAFDDPTVVDTYLSAIASGEDFFNAIVDENAWELAGEGHRKFDLIRWNLLGDKIQQFKDDYIAQLGADKYPEGDTEKDEDHVPGTYPKTLYFKYKNDNTTIDMSSIQWYAPPADTEGYEKKDFYGAERTAKTQTQIETNLPSISSGLNKEVINRHLLPISSNTISDSNGMLYNSYGYSN